MAIPNCSVELLLDCKAQIGKLRSMTHPLASFSGLTSKDRPSTPGCGNEAE